jgi:tRNA (cytidine/uridine-2'-O-)-methyltransferase
MDYLDHVTIARHASFADFESWRKQRIAAGENRRLILLSTRAEASYLDCVYQPGDILMVGRESAGVPDDVYAAADLAVRVPVKPGLRSLNDAVAAAMVVGEAMRQVEGR